MKTKKSTESNVLLGSVSVHVLITTFLYLITIHNISTY